MSVTIELHGGLGNQMFQYAAGYALAKHHGVGLTLDLRRFGEYKLRSYLLNRFPLDTHTTLEGAEAPALVHKIKRRLGFLNKETGAVYNEPHYHFNDNFFTLAPDVVLKGYFQSWKYFETVADDVRRQFTNVPAKDLPADRVKVSLHVRRGDYVTDKNAQKVHGVDLERYYKQAVETMQMLYGMDITFVLFSDDPAFIKEKFSHLQNIIVAEGDPEAPEQDIALMSACDHHILANSTFSWWGAWLNPSKTKTVIAPRQWFARAALIKDNALDLYPAGWMLL
ncbi:MAG: alpha-1,2-fucosyltransferase [Alphaproteobacteria bacterium]|nr:alpha-1,2-fucosyltransferase [Alphaproteobacteria bacterium]